MQNAWRNKHLQKQSLFLFPNIFKYALISFRKSEYRLFKGYKFSINHFVFELMPAKIKKMTFIAMIILLLLIFLLLICKVHLLNMKMLIWNWKHSNIFIWKKLNITNYSETFPTMSGRKKVFIKASFVRFLTTKNTFWNHA